RDFAFPRAGLMHHAQDFTVVFAVNVLAWRDYPELLLCIGFHRVVPDCPERAVFRPKPPQGKGADSQPARSAHLVQSAYRIQVPCLMLSPILLRVSKVWIKPVRVKLRVRVGLPRMEPLLLYGVRPHFQHALFLWIERPVITVVS